MLLGPAHGWAAVNGWANFYFSVAAARWSCIAIGRTSQRLVAGTELRFGGAKKTGRAATAGPKHAAAAMSFEHVGIIGAGSWGTALALLLHENKSARHGLGPRCRAHRADRTRARQHAPIFPASPCRTASASPPNSTPSPAAISCCSSRRRRRCAKSPRAFRPSRCATDAVLLSCTKGVERGSGLRMSEIIAESFPAQSGRRAFRAEPRGGSRAPDAHGDRPRLRATRRSRSGCSRRFPRRSFAPTRTTTWPASSSAAR